MHNRIDEYYEYRGIDCSLEQSYENLLSQTEKERKIQSLSSLFQEYKGVTKEDKKVVYISAEKLLVHFAEYVCKALLITAHKGPLLDFVFYDCSNEFIILFYQTMSIYFRMGTMDYAYKKNDFSIVLFSKKPVRELILIPQSIEKTFISNRLSGLSGDDVFQSDLLYIDNRRTDVENVTDELYSPPYDVIHKVKTNNSYQSIFETYVLQVLETNIQEKTFGCKISNTHMRLGSTIHIDTFYEAELLYNNWLFVSRFAYLLAKQIINNESFQQGDKFTLYSYALYSELFIFETINILKNLCPEKSIDYAILEREAEHRGFNHIDRIRYSTFFTSQKEQREYFKERKVICIVPINSTLKTHEKLIDLFCKENSDFSIDNIIMNFAIILVASERQNKYWEIDEENRTFTSVNLNIKPIPHYFVAIKVHYQEASVCKMCFPSNILNETPLIEVNAASTIPNQSFGLICKPLKKQNISLEYIIEEQENLTDLKRSLIYSHIKRGENHFSFYFRTDCIFIENREKIIEWMKEIDKEINIDFKDIHILVCPAHFSNAGFLEHINKFIFHEVAFIVRVDVDKEYRCNIEAKYSFFRGFFEMLSKREATSLIRLYYVDDSIVTGRTFNRAKSLISSVMNIYANEYPRLKFLLFDRIFVLLDRNSTQSRMQYLEPMMQEDDLSVSPSNRFYAYRTLHISSLRNHGDSCIICQLVKKDKILYQTSVTKWMADHWDNECHRYELRPLFDKGDEMRLDNNYVEKTGLKSSKEGDKERAFRRMICMHIANSLLSEECHGNQKKYAIIAILNLLLTDYNGRAPKSQNEAFEYLISYLKVISRPFIAFSKAVREAIFDIILVLLEYILNSGDKIFSRELKNSKPYLYDSIDLFKRVRNEIINNITDNEQKKDLLLVLMKQCMELKGNYFIRPENVRKFAKFVENYPEEQKKDIYYKYLFLVKNLVGVNSDTSKSAWFNSQLSCEDVTKDWMGLPKDIFTLLYVENVRAYYDGIERLSKDFLSDTEFLNKEIDKYQYRDFKLVIREYGWLDINEKLNLSGEKSLSSAIGLLKDVEEFSQAPSRGANRNIRNLCQKIVNRIQGIARAEKVCLGLELPMECDTCEDDKKKEFNDLLPIEMEHQKFILENKKEYLVIAGCKNRDGSLDIYSGQRPESVSAFSVQDIEAIKKFRQNNFAMECGFWLNEEEKYLIWEIGEVVQHSLIFVIKFGEFNYKTDLMLVRNVMSMYYLFCNSIFTQKTRINLYELMIAEKERILYNIDKIESHTSVDIKNQQYADVQSTEEKKEKYYKSYILTLLKDLQVSDVYRPSLHRKYYCRNLKLGSFSWENTAIEFKEDGDTFYVAGTTNYDYIKLNVYTSQTWITNDQPLHKTDELIGTKINNGVSIPFLLILALVMNAAVEGRSAIRSMDNFERIAEVDVYLTRTAADELRILNFSRNVDKAVEQAVNAIDYPPGPDEGISLWSMSRFIRSTVSIILENCLIKCRKRLEAEDSSQNQKIIEELRANMVDLLSENYHVKVEQGQLLSERLEKKEYFSISVPILSKKYEKYREYFSR